MTLVRSAVVVGLATTLLAVLTAAAPAASAQAPTSGQVGSLRSCIESAESVRVLYVMDESGSLKFTDAENNRITAAKFSLGSFLDLTIEKPVEVRLAGFSDDYRDLNNDAGAEKWTLLDQDSVISIESQIDEYAARNTGIDTDLPNALDGALEALEPIDPTTCNLVVLFADGGYDIKQRASAADKAAYGSEKPYAPGVSLEDLEGVAEARRIGRRTLCDDPNGTMSKYDQAGVRLITIALADSDFIDTTLLESLTTGRSNQTSCGTDRSGSRGVFSPVDTDSLAFSFSAITGSARGALPAVSAIAVCREGDADCSANLPVEIDSLISQFSINAQFKDPDQELVLTDPNGQIARIGYERDREIGLPGAVLKANWIDDKAVSVNVIPTGNAELVPGTWSIAALATSNASEPANLLVTRSGNLQTIIPVDEALRAGETGRVAAKITTTRGGAIEGSKLDVQAVLTDSRSKKIEVELEDRGDGEGTFDATVEIPPDFVGPATLDVQVLGTTSDLEEFTDSASGIIEVQTDEVGSVDTTSETLASKLGKLALLAAILAAAIAVWVFIWRRREVGEARFGLDGLSLSSTPIVIRSDGALFRIDGETRPLALAPADFNEHPNPAASRVVNLPSTTLTVEPAKHPFDERNAVATSEAPITGKYGSVSLHSADIDATLGGQHGTWLFIMDEQNTLIANRDRNNPSFGSIAGELLVFIDRSQTDVPRLFAELPEQVVLASRLLLRDTLSARSVGDASTDEMFDWVDQWAGDTTASNS